MSRRKNNVIFGILIFLLIIVGMGIFDFLSKTGGENKKFVSEISYEKNRANQVKMVPQTLGQLRDLGISDSKELKLEYFFYTDSNEKATILAEELNKLNYSVEYGQSAGDKKLFVVTGWTEKMKMDESTVVNWTKRMCETGFHHDCEFDGWGTNPEQD